MRIPLCRFDTYNMTSFWESNFVVVRIQRQWLVCHFAQLAVYRTTIWEINGTCNRKELRVNSKNHSNGDGAWRAFVFLFFFMFVAQIIRYNSYESSKKKRKNAKSSTTNNEHSMRRKTTETNSILSNEGLAWVAEIWVRYAIIAFVCLTFFLFSKNNNNSLRCVYGVRVYCGPESNTRIRIFFSPLSLSFTYYVLSEYRPTVNLSSVAAVTLLPQAIK